MFNVIPTDPVSALLGLEQPCQFPSIIGIRRLQVVIDKGDQLGLLGRRELRNFTLHFSQSHNLPIPRTEPLCHSKKVVWLSQERDSTITLGFTDNDTTITDRLRVQ